MQNIARDYSIDERALATINVRIPKSLKEGGEAVLEREGLSVSEAIRRFYLNLENKQKVPDFIKDNNEANAEELVAQKRALLKGLVGTAPAVRTLEQVKDERIGRHIRAGVR